MTSEQREQLRETIEQRIQELEAALSKENEDTKPVAPDTAIGRLSRLDSIQGQQMALELQRRQQAELARLRDAMKRLDTPQFGVCLLCQQEIPFERLEAMPEATLCVACSPH